MFARSSPHAEQTYAVWRSEQFINRSCRMYAHLRKRDRGRIRYVSTHAVRGTHQACRPKDAVFRTQRVWVDRINHEQDTLS
jgi:hypothetical protein